MESVFKFLFFPWKFLGIYLNERGLSNLEISLKYLIFLNNVINIIIYGFVRSILRFSDNKCIGDYISGFQAITFSIVILVKYIGIFKNTPKIAKVIKILPQSFTKEEISKFDVKKLSSVITLFYVYGILIAIFVVSYASYMLYEPNFNMIGGIWSPNGSLWLTRFYFIWMIYLNISVLSVWIYNEVIRYGLIVITIVEFRKLESKFNSFCHELKIKQKREKSKKKKVNFKKDDKNKATEKSLDSNRSKNNEILIDLRHSSQSSSQILIAPFKIVAAHFFTIRKSVYEIENSKNEQQLSNKVSNIPTLISKAQNSESKKILQKKIS